MTRTNVRATRIKPDVTELLTLNVVRREQISPHFARVTLGNGDITRFRPMGFDQWFRLFIPVPGGTLEPVPTKLDTLSYLKFLTTARTTRPVLRNYTVRAYRPVGADGPEIDVDFVLHGCAEDETMGSATSWAMSCREGDQVAILDEGITFNPPATAARVLLVADESALPAVAGILASLPDDVSGRALIEIPAEQDRQDLRTPPGVVVTWIVRDDEAAIPGRAVLRAVQAVPPTKDDSFHCWVAGEQGLATGVRRHMIGIGIPKDRITFCGYWRAGRHH